MDPTSSMKRLEQHINNHSHTHIVAHWHGASGWVGGSLVRTFTPEDVGEHFPPMARDREARFASDGIQICTTNAADKLLITFHDPPAFEVVHPTLLTLKRQHQVGTINSFIQPFPPQIRLVPPISSFILNFSNGKLSLAEACVTPLMPRVPAWWQAVSGDPKVGAEHSLLWLHFQGALHATPFPFPPVWVHA